MVNPGIFRDGKYPKISKIGKYWEMKTLIKKIYYIFFLYKVNFILNMVYYVTAPFKICYKIYCIGTLYKMKMKAASL